MPDSDGNLIPADVATFTLGRLAADDPRVAQLLTDAVADARTLCGWHVTPVRQSTMTLDGPGSPLLVLPTLRMTGLAEVTEDGVDLDVSTLAWSSRGLVRKKSGARWSCEFGSITVKFTHGFAAADAAGWRRAVLSCVDRRSLDLGGGQPTRVGPFEWGSSSVAGMFSQAEQAALELFRLEKPA